MRNDTEGKLNWKQECARTSFVFKHLQLLFISFISWQSMVDACFWHGDSIKVDFYRCTWPREKNAFCG